MIHMPVRKLNKFFKSLGITITKPGFYDDPSFLKNEQQDPNFLKTYPSYVTKRDYSEEYLNRTRKIIPIVSEILYTELVTEKRGGACIDLSMMLSRILEEEGIWCYVAKGALKISFSASLNIPPVYFWPFDVDLPLCLQFATYRGK